MQGRPFVVRSESVARRRATRTSTSEPLGWVRGLLEGETALRVDLIELPPGERVAPEHAHSARDELFFVLAGTVTPIVGGEELESIGAHTLFVIPHGSAASTLRNASDTTATLLQVSTAPGEDVVCYAPESGRE